MTQRTAMSVSDRRIGATIRTSVLWIFLGCSGAALAADEEQPDLELLEYLGSWDGSDEDWLLFVGAEERRDAVDGATQSDPAPDVPDVEESAELNDES